MEGYFRIVFLGSIHFAVCYSVEVLCPFLR